MAELGELSLRPLAAKQVSAKLVFQLLDGARQRRLGHVALFGRAGEVPCAGDRQKIPDVMHVHSDPVSTQEQTGISADGTCSCRFAVRQGRRRYRRYMAMNMHVTQRSTAAGRLLTGIARNAIRPGNVYTPLVGAQIEGEARAHGMPREQVIR